MIHDFRDCFGSGTSFAISYFDILETSRAGRDMAENHRAVATYRLDRLADLHDRSERPVNIRIRLLCQDIGCKCLGRLFCTGHLVGGKRHNPGLGQCGKLFKSRPPLARTHCNHFNPLGSSLDISAVVIIKFPVYRSVDHPLLVNICLLISPLPKSTIPQ